MASGCGDLTKRARLRARATAGSAYHPRGPMNVLARQWTGDDPSERSADTRAEAPHDVRPQPGAQSQQSDLERGLKTPFKPEEARPKASGSGSASILTRRVVKIALGLSLIAALGWGPLRAMLSTTSVEALVNARVDTIRSPIEGIVASAPDGASGWSASEPAPRLRIFDPLADHGRLDDLKRQRDALDSEALRLASQSELTRAALATLDAQVEKFRDARLRLLDARLSTQEALREAAAAKSAQAEAARRRSDALSKSGAYTAAENDRRLYDWVAASSAETAEAKRLDETKVERSAIAQGVFVGDSYNDSPNSQQRAAELRLNVAALEAQAAATRSQLKLLDEQIAEEAVRFRARSEAYVDLPSKGRVWEMLTAPGERVAKGQDLMRVLDCSRPLVSANVEESVYNRLEVGGRAQFRPAQQGAEAHGGVIVNLMGAAAASGNFAIPLAAMRKSPFYVTVALDGMIDGACAVGRTGTVTFGPADEKTSAAAADVGLWASGFDSPPSLRF
jgi:multidrug resistance efflux pump